MTSMNNSFERHLYQPGEAFDYFFEVFEITYSTELIDQMPVIRDLQKIEELILRLRLSVVSMNQQNVTKRVELTDSRYRELTAKDLMEKHSSTILYQSLSSLIPGFPDNLEYHYENGDFTAELNQAFTPYLGHPLGVFLHYKMLDVHSFQSMIDSIPEGEVIGNGAILPSEDIELEHGVFHNHHPVYLYHRVDRLNGVNHAYFKVQTMGNIFRVPEQNMELYTDYQMTFHVPLAGEAAGLLSSGEQQEFAFVVQGDGPVIAIQRQISMQLQTEHVRSGINWNGSDEE